VLVRATRLDVQGGAVLLVLVQDITEQRLAVRLLEESERRLAKIVEASPEAITIREGRGRRLRIEVNPASERLSGYTREEMIGRSSLKLFWLDAGERGRFVTGPAARRDDPTDGRSSFGAKDGQLRKRPRLGGL